MAEVFSDDLNLKIGDLLSRPLSHATRPPCARPFLLTRPIQAHTCMFARALVQASRAHPLLLGICSHALSRVFQEPKTPPEYTHFEPSHPYELFTGKKHIFSFDAPPSRSRPLLPLPLRRRTGNKSAQNQTRLLPHLRLKAPCGQTPHLPNHWKLTTQ
jgi:hypothetical protein